MMPGGIISHAWCLPAQQAHLDCAAQPAPRREGRNEYKKLCIVLALQQCCATKPCALRSRRGTLLRLIRPGLSVASSRSPWGAAGDEFPRVTELVAAVSFVSRMKSRWVVSMTERAHRNT